ncbi:MULTISPECIES: flagellar hook-length control protein FliK [Pontibacillus]|uniref:Flagellar hook-length control protein FliK n=1 Tax=Pontibacillus chungwhensis TaxID=265426 RepID=A0ABY8V205_9BACI|nr:flagellar hook-length control protein FliK [Pontibacillus chungwhensis]MCD5322686.1 flagellar hook-length control protein FliK [Pontibacillus sp. HN14]WIF99962.1 flagellar hook-length control protein FliK [Pontibacillus chungwhensis]
MNGNVALLQQLGVKVNSKPTKNSPPPSSAFTNKLEAVLANVTKEGDGKPLYKNIREILDKETKLSSLDKELKSLLNDLQTILQSSNNDEVAFEDIIKGVKGSANWEVLSKKAKSNIKTLAASDDISIILNSLKEMLQPKSGFNEDPAESLESSIEQLVALDGWLANSNGNNVENVQLREMQKKIENITTDLITILQEFNTSKENSLISAFSLEGQLNPVFNSVDESKVNSESLRIIASNLKNTLQKLNQLRESHISDNTLKASAIYKELHSIAEQLLKMDKSGQTSFSEIKPSLEQLKNSKAVMGFEHALENLRKRSDLSVKNQYTHNASVTTKEFGKWIQNAWNRMGDKNDSIADASLKPTSFTSANDSMVMSKQEQMVIKLSPNTQSDQTMQKQLIEEFQKVMSRSRFSMNKAGSQLSIKLNPGSLGDMMVKMTQQNGEMMVKIMVTTQAAKDMLEGNMNQLRHMFSPNQVQVEKQDVTIQADQSFTFDKEQDHKEDERPQQEQEQNVTENEEEESIRFHDVLMNEKV